MHPLTVEGAMASHPGCVRGNNEDSVGFILPGADAPASLPELIAIVADGMGGHAAGEVASRMAVDAIMPFLRDSALPPPDALAGAIASANAAVHARAAADPACAGMGTTCTTLLLRAGLLFLAHVGDSRAYLLRAGALERISEDHSAVGELVRNGQLTEEQARRSPHRNIILRALGAKAEVEPQVWPQGRQMLAGDVLLLCSDGLTDVVTEAEIAPILRAPPAEACQALLDAAIAAGAPDNVSVGVFALVARAAAEADTAPTVPIAPPDFTLPGSRLA